MANCSKTVDFFKERDRMCKMYACSDACPFNRLLAGCHRLIQKDPEAAVEVVQRWSDAHPEQEATM
jgi:hypothetical protein